jgi:hypothetical protein
LSTTTQKEETQKFVISVFFNFLPPKLISWPNLIITS